MDEEATTQGDIAASGFDTAWEEVRANEDIQFTSTVKQPEPPPQWLTDLLEWLDTVFAPIGAFLQSVWPELRIILLVLLALGVLTLLWVIIAPYVDSWRQKDMVAEDDWQPEQQAARQWLREADALAAEQRFEEAAHLLLFRSIEDIEKRRPHLLKPSHTAREIENFEGLPDQARTMFAVIAEHVERAVFAADSIGEQGWLAAREAYGRFALADSWQGAGASRG